MSSISGFYPITDRALSGGRGHAELVALLCAGGARLIQLRDKTMPVRRILEAAREAAAIAHAQGARLIVNDRVDVALLAGADGGHLGGEDLPADAARRVLAPGALLGVSTHSAQAAIAAAALPVDYVALGPIFPTAHAATVRPPVGLVSLAAAARAIQVPIVAIGGIHIDNAADVLAAGASSVAVMGDVMTAADIPARVAQYLSLIT